MLENIKVLNQAQGFDDLAILTIVLNFGNKFINYWSRYVVQTTGKIKHTFVIILKCLIFNLCKVI